MSSKRSIVHMDLDTFFVSCERKLDSRLEGKPILIGGTSDRGVVASCSYEARAYGVHSAMPMKLAMERCPDAVIIKGHSGIYSEHSKMVTEIVREAVPVFEKTSIDEFYVDLTGMDRFFGTYKFTQELRKKIIKETGLPISFGLSENKTVSKIATGEAKPNNQMKVDYGSEKSFLAPLSVKKIPMVGKKTFKLLCDLGVRKIETIQEMPMDLVEAALGDNGKSIWKKANGIDNNPVVQYNERKSISTERTFEKDTIDYVKLKGMIASMGENLAFQLRKQNKMTSCVSVKIRYSDFQTHTLQKMIPYTVSDHEILPILAELFDKIYNRRLLVRLIGVKFSSLVNGHYQLSLFDTQTDYSSLYSALDKIRIKYGDKAVLRAVGLHKK